MGALLAIGGVQPWLRRSSNFWISLVIAIVVQLLLGFWISWHVPMQSRNGMKGAGFLTLAVGYAAGAGVFVLLQKLRPNSKPQSESLETALRR
jgi:hypothetical protein